MSEKGSMQLLLEYEASLEGHVVLYFPKVNEHYYSDPSEAHMFDDVRWNNSIRATQLVDISIFSKAQIDVKDKLMYEVIMVSK